MNWLREIAKFACGAEAFHAFVHGYFWLSATTLHVFGWLTETPTVHMWGAFVNAVIALLLGIYGWQRWQPYGARRPFGRRAV